MCAECEGDVLRGIQTGSRASQDADRDVHLTDDETVVDAEQGNGTLLSLCIRFILESEGTDPIPCSPHAHHLPAAARRGPQSRYPPNLHTGTAIYAGAHNKVRKLSRPRDMQEEDELTKMTASWRTQRSSCPWQTSKIPSRDSWQ
jgi:hypothetical protein